MPTRPTSKPLTERPWESPFPNSITPSLLRKWTSDIPTPFYVYDLKTIKRRIKEVKSFLSSSLNQKKIGKRRETNTDFNVNFTPRYAIKANPNLSLLKIFHEHGIHFDASSEFEVERILQAKIPHANILLTAQQIPRAEGKFRNYFKHGLEYNASSLRQIEWFGKICPNKEISIRINPGFGSGMNAKTTVGGANSGFGIWHEYIKEIHTLLKKYNLIVKRLHTHVGSGSDPNAWEKVTTNSLSLLKHFPSATVLNIGGGFKISRTPNDFSANVSVIGKKVKAIIGSYLKQTKKKLKFEIEPGTFYIAEAGLLIAEVEDVVSTGTKKITPFIKLNCGMNDFIRPTLYNSNHHIDIVPKTVRKKSPLPYTTPYIVIGHCCESGDIFTEKLSYQKETTHFSPPLPQDIAIVHGAGAYGSAMASRYNSFPLIAEYLFQDSKKSLTTIRKSETLKDIIKNEM